MNYLQLVIKCTLDVLHGVYLYVVTLSVVNLSFLYYIYSLIFALLVLHILFIAADFLKPIKSYTCVCSCTVAAKFSIRKKTTETVYYCYYTKHNTNVSTYVYMPQVAD